jgi:hypothetical protein
MSRYRHITSFEDRKKALLENVDFLCCHNAIHIINSREVVVRDITVGEDQQLDIYIESSNDIIFKDVQCVASGQINVYITSSTSGVVFDNCRISKITVGGFSIPEVRSRLMFSDAGPSIEKRLGIFGTMCRPACKDVLLTNNTRVHHVTVMNGTKPKVSKDSFVAFCWKLPLFLTRIWFIIRQVFSDDQFVPESRIYLNMAPHKNSIESYHKTYENVLQMHIINGNARY